MKEGMYGVTYQSGGGVGNGVFVLENGRIFGADLWGGKYDGEYTYSEDKKLAELKLKIGMAPNAMSVLGIQHPYEWAVDAVTTFDPSRESGQLVIRTALGPSINATYKFLRALPDS